MKEKIKQNYLEIEKNISTLSNGSAKPKIIAVTKSVGLQEIKCLIELGLHHFAENRIEIAEEKKIAFPSKDITWHFIGNIQSRKAKRIVQFADIIHSIDSLDTAKKICQEATKISKVQKVLLQVNISGEKQKNGFSKEELLNSIEELKRLVNLKIIGLMTMAPLSSNEALVRKTFADLRKISQELINLFSIQIPELSMGMTNDYKIAIQEGATMLRIGSAFFEEGN